MVRQSALTRPRPPSPSVVPLPPLAFAPAPFLQGRPSARSSLPAGIRQRVNRFQDGETQAPAGARSSLQSVPLPPALFMVDHDQVLTLTEISSHAHCSGCTEAAAPFACAFRSAIPTGCPGALSAPAWRGSLRQLPCTGMAWMTLKHYRGRLRCAPAAPPLPPLSWLYWRFSFLLLSLFPAPQALRGAPGSRPAPVTWGWLVLQPGASSPGPEIPAPAACPPIAPEGIAFSREPSRSLP